MVGKRPPRRRLRALRVRLRRISPFERFAFFGAFPLRFVLRAFQPVSCRVLFSSWSVLPTVMERSRASQLSTAMPFMASCSFIVLFLSLFSHKEHKEHIGFVALCVALLLKNQGGGAIAREPFPNRARPSTNSLSNEGFANCRETLLVHPEPYFQGFHDFFTM